MNSKNHKRLVVAMAIIMVAGILLSIIVPILSAGQNLSFALPVHARYALNHTFYV